MPDSVKAGTLRAEAKALAEQGQWLSALKLYDRIAGQGKAGASDWYEMGVGLFELGEHAQALGALERSVKLDPRPPEGWHRLAWCCYRLGDVDRAVKLLDKIKNTDPSCSVRTSLATIIPGAPGASQRKIRKTREQSADCLAKTIKPVSLRRKKDPHARTGPLRVAYFSSFFNRANYMKPVWGLINHHDRINFRVFLYDDHGHDEDFPGYVAQPGDEYRNTSELANREIVALVEQDDLDVLVDLNAYSTPTRLGLFLSSPAPVTVAWFNMYATSGLPGFDWIVGDEETLLPGEEKYYSEKIERLPLSYLTFDVSHPAPPIVDPPCLKQDYLTFGSLASQY